VFAAWQPPLWVRLFMTEFGKFIHKIHYIIQYITKPRPHLRWRTNKFKQLRHTKCRCWMPKLWTLPSNPFSETHREVQRDIISFIHKTTSADVVTRYRELNTFISPWNISKYLPFSQVTGIWYVAYHHANEEEDKLDCTHINVYSPRNSSGNFYVHYYDDRWVYKWKSNHLT
jgi:hypothetical protein